MERTMEEIARALQAPFPAERVSWKPQTVKGERALAVPYVDARDVAERLDEVVGPFNWQSDHRYEGNQLLSGIGIRNPETSEWIWKWDAGLVVAEARGGSGREVSADERIKATKGTISDGFKRAAVLWGVFRYAYRLPKAWVPYDAERRRLLEVPTLPAWALPEGERGQARAQPAGERDGDGRRKGSRGKRGPAGKGNGDGDGRKGKETPAAPPDYLRMTVPFGTKEHPEFRGQTVGDLLGSAEGQRFVRYLAVKHEPKNAEQRALVEGIQALAAAGQDLELAGLDLAPELPRHRQAHPTAA